MSRRDDLRDLEAAERRLEQARSALQPTLDELARSREAHPVAWTLGGGFGCGLLADQLPIGTAFETLAGLANAGGLVARFATLIETRLAETQTRDDVARAAPATDGDAAAPIERTGRAENNSGE